MTLREEVFVSYDPSRRGTNSILIWSFAKRCSWAFLYRPPTNVRVKSRSWQGHLWKSGKRGLQSVCRRRNPTARVPRAVWPVLVCIRFWMFHCWQTCNIACSSRGLVEFSLPRFSDCSKLSTFEFDELAWGYPFSKFVIMISEYWWLSMSLSDELHVSSFPDLHCWDFQSCPNLNQARSNPNLHVLNQDYPFLVLDHPVSRSIISEFEIHEMSLLAAEY